MRTGACPVEYLHDRDDRHHLGGDGHDFWVVGEEEWELVAKAKEDCQVQETDDKSSEKCLRDLLAERKDRGSPTISEKGTYNS